MDLKRIKWSNNYVIPQIFKTLVPENLYKEKIFKYFTIVTMLRNYVAPNKENKENLILINKQLITNAINTSELTQSNTKVLKIGTYSEKYQIRVYNVAIHVNNKFNPTEIKMFNQKNMFHLYHQYGDETLHINMGILTLLNVLSNNSDQIKIRNSKIIEDYRKK